MSTPGFSAEGRASAIAVLAESKAIGDQIGLSHRGAAEVSLYALVLVQDIGGEAPQKGRKVETGFIQCDVAIGQTGFALMTNNQRPITQGDVIQYPLASGRYFKIPDDPKAIEQLANGYVYRFWAKERKTITLGVHS